MVRRNDDGMGDQLLDKTREIGGSLKDIGVIVKDAVAEKFEELKMGATRVGKKAGDRAIEVKDNVEEYVAEKPMKSLLISAGIGLLLGLILRRRRSA